MFRRHGGTWKEHVNTTDSRKGMQSTRFQSNTIVIYLPIHYINLTLPSVASYTPNHSSLFVSRVYIGMAKEGWIRKHFIISSNLERLKRKGHIFQKGDSLFHTLWGGLIHPYPIPVPFDLLDIHVSLSLAAQSEGSDYTHVISLLPLCVYARSKLVASCLLPFLPRGSLQILMISFDRPRVSLRHHCPI